MRLNTYFLSQKSLAKALKQVIDDFASRKITEEKMIKLIKVLYNNNKELFLKDGKIPTSVNQILGKRRLRIIRDILNI